MPLATYADLQSTIAAFLNRTDLTAIIPTFVALAEAQIKRDVRHWRMIERSAATFTGRYTALPDDWLETVRLTVDGWPLTLQAYAEMTARRDANSDTAGRPLYYSHVGDEIEVWPTPDQSMTGEIVYLQMIPALSDSVTSNWLLTMYPDVYLYGALVQSAPYLQEDERAQTWAGLYAAAVARLNAESEAARFSGSRLRVGRPR